MRSIIVTLAVYLIFNLCWAISIQAQHEKSAISSLKKALRDTTKIKPIFYNYWDLEELNSDFILGVTPYQQHIQFSTEAAQQLALNNQTIQNSLTPLVAFGFSTTIDRFMISYKMSSTWPFRPKMMIEDQFAEKIGEGVYDIWNQDATLTYRLPYRFFMGIGFHQFTANLDYLEQTTSENQFRFLMPDHNTIYFKAGKKLMLKNWTLHSSVTLSMNSWYKKGPIQEIDRTFISSTDENLTDKTYSITQPSQYSSFSIGVHHPDMGPFSLLVSFDRQYGSELDFTTTKLTLQYRHVFDWLENWGS
jgi:hypothetical protein